MTKNKQDNLHDVLGAYPEREQVDAFPERRYIRLTRFLTIFTVINLAMVIALSTVYFYMARHKDISVSQKNWVHLYTIDPERKLLLPSEHGQGNVSAMQLMMEDALRKYITQRYESVWDVDTMRERWGDSGYVARLSSQEIKPGFNAEVGRTWNDIWQKKITRDVHIYSLFPLRGDMWSAYIETFDFPLNDDLRKICDCSDNSHECLACKEKNALPGSRRRRKILLRANFEGPKNLGNPLGIMVYAYYPALVPIFKETSQKEKFWDLPPALRPAL